MKVEMIIHTTCDVEMELVELETGKVIIPRTFVAEEGDYDAENAAKIRMKNFCKKKGFDLVSEVWS